MKIIIVGNGKVGFSLAEQLVAEKHDVTIVDIQEQALSHAVDSLDLMVLHGSGISSATLLEAGADRADLLVASTSSDEVNVVCCMLAKNLGTTFTIARVRNPEYSTSMSDLRRELKIDMVINPESATAVEITRLLRFPAAANIQTFCQGRVELMSFRLQEGDFLVGNPLRTLSTQIKRLSLLFCAADRDGTLIIPNGAFVPKAGDQLYIIGRPESLDQFFRTLGRYTSKLKQVFILGGGKITNYLLPLLHDFGIGAKVVDLREDRCRKIHENFPKVAAICGDGTDLDLLESERMTDYGGFVALTDHDEDNFIISLYALHEKISKVITKCNRKNYAGIARSVGLDSVISPKFITASTILHVVRGMENSQGSVMNSLYRIADGAAEAMEFTVSPSTLNQNVVLRDLQLKPGILIAVIVRGQEIIIPEGSSYLQTGDRVIIIAPNGRILDLNDIYASATPIIRNPGSAGGMA